MKKSIVLLFFLVCCLSNSIVAQNSIVKPQLPDTSHSPKLATTFALILPGLGHIYNQIHKTETQRNNLWWKLPIIYGGLGSVSYLAIDNHQSFKMFKNERLARLDTNYVSSTLSSWSDSQLKVYQDQYDRWRNLNIIAGLGIYLLQVIDANVEGHLMHFDASDDLSIDFHPIVKKYFWGNTTGITVRFSFK